VKIAKNQVAARKIKQKGLAVASIARDDPSTLPGDDPFPRARMHRDRNAYITSRSKKLLCNLIMWFAEKLS